MKIKVANALSNIDKATNDEYIKEQLIVIQEALTKKRSDCCNKKVYLSSRGYLCNKCNSHCDLL